jgi:sigma-E factor negative regulatory protein RseA
MSNNPEQLSAGMDGELGTEELRFLLRRLDHDASLQVRWSRFHVASASLRGELPALASSAFADRVMQAIAAEAAAVAPRERRSNWLKFSAGGAIAASVAVVALMASRPAGHSAVDAPLAAPSVAKVSEPAPSPMQAAPAAVPAWLSNTNAFRYSQQAAFPAGDAISPYEQSLSPYRVNGYRTRQNADGSYLLLIDPTRQTVRRPVREAAVAQ